MGCSDDGDDVPGATAGSAGKGGTAGAGGKNTAGSNSTAGKGGSGGTFGTAGDTSTAGGGTDGGGMAGTAGTGGTPECTTDGQCDDGDVCTDDTCDDGTCKHGDNTAVCDDENACTSDDKCDAGECKGTNNTDDCDDLSSCTPGQDKCAEGKCGGAPDVSICPKCDDGKNLILNCDFTKGADGLESWEHNFVFGGGGIQTVINERNVIDITAGGTNSWQVQPLQNALTLKQGMKYKLRIVAGASIERQITVSITRYDADYEVYSKGPSLYGGYDLDLTPQMKFFEHEFRFMGMVAKTGDVPAGDETNAKIEVKVGNREFEEPMPDFAGTSVYFDDVYLAEVPCAGAGECDDGNACTTDTCEVNGACKWTPLADHEACTDDMQSCTTDECIAGACAHTPLDDDATCATDDDDCTIDACTAGECKHNFDNTVCDCQLDVHCEDDNVCTDDKCVDGQCENTDNTADCDDDNVCTSTDVCDAGVCGGTNNTDACTDTDVCTVNNMCAAGACGAGTNVCFDCTADGNLVTNCGFDTNLDGWTGGVYGGAATITAENGFMVINTTNAGDQVWMIQPFQPGLILTEAVSYTVKFNAYASVARKLIVSMTQNGAPYTSYGGPQTFNVTTDMQLFTYTFVMCPDMSCGAPPEKVKFEFDLGGGDSNPTVPNTLYIDNVYIGPTP